MSGTVTGTIVGGWQFIWAAFIVTWSALALYSLSLLWRERKSRDEDARGGRNG